MSRGRDLGTSCSNLFRPAYREWNRGSSTLNVSVDVSSLSNLLASNIVESSFIFHLFKKRSSIVRMSGHRDIVVELSSDRRWLEIPNVYSTSGETRNNNIGALHGEFD